MYHGSSLAACSGGDITSFLGRTSWSTVVVATRVWMVWGEVAYGEVMPDVHLTLELGELFVEAVCFHPVFDPLEGFIFLVDFGDDGSPINFKFSAALVVSAVAFHFCEGSRVFEATCCFSKGVVGPSPGLE